MKKEFRLYLTAKMYYVVRMTQTEIAEAFGTSKMMVSRMLKRAETEGIVTFKVNSPNKINWEMGKQVKECFPLMKEVLVVMPEDEDSRKSVAVVAADYVKSLLCENNVIGLSWGKTILEFINEMDVSDVPNLKVVQMSGNFLYTNNYEMMPSNIVKRFGEKTGATPFFFDAPMFVVNEENRTLLMQDPLFQHLEKLFEKMTICIFGVSEISKNATMVRVGVLQDEDLHELIEKGAVGDVMGFFVDGQGEVVNWSKMSCYMGATLDVVSKAQHAICLATGVDKRNITNLVMKRGYCNKAIISYDLASELLKI